MDLEDFKDLKALDEFRRVLPNDESWDVITRYTDLNETEKRQVRTDFFGIDLCYYHEKYFFSHYSLIFNERFKNYALNSGAIRPLVGLSRKLHEVFLSRTHFVTDIKLQNYARQMNDSCVGIYFLLRMRFDESAGNNIGQLGKLVESNAQSDEFASFPKIGRHFKYLIFLSAIAFGFVERDNFDSQFRILTDMYLKIYSRWCYRKESIWNLQQTRMKNKKRSKRNLTLNDPACLHNLENILSIFKESEGLSEEKVRRLKVLKNRPDQELKEKHRQEKKDSMLRENIINEKRFLLCMYPFIGLSCRIKNS